MCGGIRFRGETERAACTHYVSSLASLCCTPVYLAGAIPPELGELEALEVLMVPHNELSGKYVLGQEPSSTTAVSCAVLAEAAVMQLL